jgi:hypothetical protein
LRGIEHQINLI